MKTVGHIIWIVTSCVILVIGILALLYSNDFFNSLLINNLKLKNGTEHFKKWIDPPIDMFFNFYLFDLKNPIEFQNGEKPEFQEIGPFICKEFMLKEEIVDNPNNTLSYKQRKYYQLMPTSPFNDSYEITTINFVLLTFLNRIKYRSWIIHKAFDNIVSSSKEQLIIKMPVKKLLFGYKDELLVLAKLVNIFDHNLVPSEYAGLFYNKNNTVEGAYNIYTGSDNISNIGIIKRFNNKEKLNVWSNSYANMINGTDGSLFGPFISKESMYVFKPDLCRSLKIVYNETIRTTDYIKLYGFKADDLLFANASIAPDNQGFCIPAGNCLGSGVLNLTNCLNGLPIVASFPHFLNADQKYQLKSLRPDSLKHSTSVYIEPLTGFPMQANLRMQFNLPIESYPEIDSTKNLQNMLYPLYWVDENFKLDKKNADLFVYSVVIPFHVLYFGKFVLTGIGSIMLISFSISLTVFCFKNKKSTIIASNEEQSPLINSNEEQSLLINSNEENESQNNQEENINE